MHWQAQEQLSDADWREGESRKEVVRMHSHLLALRSALQVCSLSPRHSVLCLQAAFSFALLPACTACLEVCIFSCIRRAVGHHSVRRLLLPLQASSDISRRLACQAR